MTTDTLRWRFEDASLHLPGTATQILLQTSSDTSVDSLYRQAVVVADSHVPYVPYDGEIFTVYPVLLIR